jgi:hypothetical protein
MGAVDKPVSSLKVPLIRIPELFFGAADAGPAAKI